MGNRTLPDLRFVIGAALATALLVVTAFGVAVTLRLSHQAKVGPLEASRSLAYADQTDWNQFQDPTAARRFEDMTRPIDGESVQPSLDPPAGTATEAPQPVAPLPTLETPARDTASVPQDGNATPVVDDHAINADLEAVIVPAPAAATNASLPEAAAATGPDETPAVEVAAIDPPATVPATIEPAPPAAVISAPAPTAELPAASEVDRVASIPATSPGDITAVEPFPPLPKAAPASRQMAKLAPQAKPGVARSRLVMARARALRVARARIARARAATQQSFAPTGFTATTGQPRA
jgi:hypothetical protein